MESIDSFRKLIEQPWRLPLLGQAACDWTRLLAERWRHIRVQYVLRVRGQAMVDTRWRPLSEWLYSWSRDKTQRLSGFMSKKNETGVGLPAPCKHVPILKSAPVRISDTTLRTWFKKKKHKKTPALWTARYGSGWTQTCKWTFHSTKQVCFFVFFFCF